MTDPTPDTGLAAGLLRPVTPQYRDDQAGLAGAEPVAVYAPQDAAGAAAVRVGAGDRWAGGRG